MWSSKYRQHLKYRFGNKQTGDILHLEKIRKRPEIKSGCARRQQEAIFRQQTRKQLPSVVEQPFEKKKKKKHLATSSAAANRLPNYKCPFKRRLQYGNIVCLKNFLNRPTARADGTAKKFKGQQTCCFHTLKSDLKLPHRPSTII